MKNKLVLLLIIVWAVLTNALSIYFWRTNKKLGEINTLLLESLIASGQLAENMSNAYKTFGECVTNQGICNPQESTKKLQKLNEEKEQINSKIQEIQKELRSLENE